MRETTPEAWRQLPRHKELPPEEFERVIDALLSFDLSGDKRMATARNGDVERARAANWDDFLDKGLARKVHSGECAAKLSEILRQGGKGNATT